MSLRRGYFSVAEVSGAWAKASELSTCIYSSGCCWKFEVVQEAPKLCSSLPGTLRLPAPLEPLAAAVVVAAVAVLGVWDR